MKTQDAKMARKLSRCQQSRLRLHPPLLVIRVNRDPKYGLLKSHHEIESSGWYFMGKMEQVGKEMLIAKGERKVTFCTFIKKNTIGDGGSTAL